MALSNLAPGVWVDADAVVGVQTQVVMGTTYTTLLVDGCSNSVTLWVPASVLTADDAAKAINALLPQ
jgi:hypothetical protein